jgi:hypothetical protein
MNDQTEKAGTYHTVEPVVHMYAVIYFYHVPKSNTAINANFSVLKAKLVSYLKYSATR